MDAGLPIMVEGNWNSLEYVLVYYTDIAIHFQLHSLAFSLCSVIVMLYLHRRAQKYGPRSVVVQLIHGLRNHRHPRPQASRHITIVMYLTMFVLSSCLYSTDLFWWFMQTKAILLEAPGYKGRITPAAKALQLQSVPSISFMMTVFTPSSYALIVSLYSITCMHGSELCKACSG